MTRLISNDEYLELFAKSIYMDRLMKHLGVETPKQAAEKVESATAKLSDIQQWANQCKCDREPLVTVSSPAGCGFGDGWE